MLTNLFARCWVRFQVLVKPLNLQLGGLGEALAVDAVVRDVRLTSRLSDPKPIRRFKLARRAIEPARLHPVIGSYKRLILAEACH